MNDVRVKIHPKLGVLVGTDGHVMVPGDKFHKSHWTRGSRMRSGYFSVCVNKQKNLLVHRLVLETFVGQCPEGMECDHVNRDRSDNRLQNLRWVPHKENQRNTANNSRCLDRLGVNYYVDSCEANRRNCASWYHKNKDNYNARRRLERKLLQENNLCRGL